MTEARPLTTSATAGEPSRRFTANHVDSLGIDAATWVRERLEDAHPDWVRELLSTVADVLMHAEAQSICDGDGATRPRANRINGHRKWVWVSQAGKISLAVPRLRRGGYFPSWLPKQGTSQATAEHAILDLIAKACTGGVSTQMVDDLVRSLGTRRISESEASHLATTLNERAAAFRNRSLDAGAYRYVWIEGLTECRLERGQIVNVVTAVARGVGAQGNQEILGVEVLRAEDTVAWTRFVGHLVTRGLSGVNLVVADCDSGLKAAVAELISGALWQRGRASLMRDLLAAVPAPAHALVALLIGSIYAQPSAEAVRAQHARVVEQLRGRFPKAAELLADASSEMLAFVRFPKEDWPQIVSTRPSVSLEGPDMVTIRHQDPNFYVIAPGPARPAGNGSGGADKRNSRGKAGTKALAVAQVRPAPARTRMDALIKRLPTKRLTNLASRIDTVANAFPWRPSLARDDPAPAAALQIPAWPGALAVITVLAGVFAAHAINMFNFPRYELDEGTYMSSAWAILNNQVTAYPYGYGHPPLGWIQIAAWTRLTGGFFTFGNALNSGRVLMLFSAVGSSFLVYLIAHRMSGRRAIGLLAMVLFSFSPLSLAYPRQVLLDNIAVFWLLLSVYFIVASRSRMAFIVAAGLSFGAAVLSKETFVILGPVMIYALWLNITRYQRMFGLITFTFTVVALGSGLVLMALLKGELFPYAWHLPWDHSPHLSLLDTFAVQVQRSQSEGKFSDSWYTWTHADPLLMGLSIAATAFNLIVGLWKRNQLFLALAAVSYWALLLRGGVVLSFYVIVLIPLVALNAAMAVNTIVSWVRGWVRLELATTVLILGITAGIMASDIGQSDVALTQHPTSAQAQSMAWIRNHVSRDSVVVVNSYLYMDLRQPGGAGVGDGATYPYAHVYWNIAYDPELHDGLLQNNWDRIDYIAADSEMLHDINTAGGPMSLLATALNHSILLQEFRADDNEHYCSTCLQSDTQLVISVYQVIHKQPQT